MHSRFITILFLFCSPGIAQAALSVFACEPEWAALARELGGEQLNVYSATTAMQDPHHIQARPSLIAKARRAELLVCTGAELEIGWLPLLLRKAGNASIQPGRPGHLMAADHVRLSGVPAVLDRSLGDIHAMGNPHIHTQPQNIAAVATELNRRLQQLDAGHASIYQQRYQDFMQRWKAAIARWEQQAEKLRGKHIMVNHDSWVYLNDWLGLVQVAVLEPKPGISPSTEHLGELLKTIQQQPVDGVIYAAYQSSKAVHWLTERADIAPIKLPFTVGGIEGVDTLFELFDETINRLTEAMP